VDEVQPPPNDGSADTDPDAMSLTHRAGHPGPESGQPGQPAPGATAVDGDRVWKIVAAFAAIALIGFIVYVVTRPHSSRPAAYPVTPPAALAIGSEAPTFVLPRLGGGPEVSLTATAGKPMVVNFFASWCRNCQAELASFAALSRRADRVAVVGVDSNDTDGTKAQALLARAGAAYPVGVDGNAKVATAYLLSALPVTYFLDAGHRVVHVGFGSQSTATLDHWAGVLAAGTAAQ